eukprot:228002-Pyramimonas_sp.AAC.1
MSYRAVWHGNRKKTIRRASFGLRCFSFAPSSLPRYPAWGRALARAMRDCRARIARGSSSSSR